MKKILKSFLFLLLGITLFPTTNVSAANYTESFNETSQWIPNDYVIKEKGGTKKYQQLTVITRNSDGQFVYCIEPGTPLGNAIHSGQDYDQAYVANMTNEQWRRISLLAYYGYGYGSHTDLKWYTVTQYLIWQTVPHGYDIYFTDSLNGNRITKYTNEINELNRLVSEHYTTPNFNTSNLEMVIGDTITLNDANGVLNKFTISGQNNVNASISGNQLNITATSVGSGNITIAKRDTNYSHPAIVYVHPTSQDIMMRGAYDPIDLNYNIKVYGGKVSVKKVDAGTGLSVAQGDASLTGALYGIYDMVGNRVGEVKSIGGEYVTSDYLPKLGTFYLKEEKASLGYKLNETKYYFEITKDNLYPKVDVSEKVIERKLEIFKVFANGSTGMLTGEPNVKYDIYLKSSNKKVATITTSSTGYAEITLPYGTYRVSQVSSTTNFEKAEDFEIVINEDNSDPIHKVIANAEITAKLKVVKIDSESKNIIARSNIKFRIIDVATGEYVKQTITYPTAQTIDVFETDSTGTLITPLPLKSGIYKLEEVDQAIDGYLWNSTSKEFEIGENSELITDKEFGVIFETKFENTQVKGEVTINKLGEKLVIEDGSYHYEEIKLDGVKYDLYAEKDIYSADGTLIYKANELVGSYETKDGFLKVSGLYLGSYYFLENSTLDSHVLDTTKHSFTLKYKDQYTPIVSLEFTFKNYMKKGTLDFTKTDIAGDPIPNTKIQIWTNNEDEESVLVFEGVTDESGKITITDLFPSKFKLIETEASTGFRLSDEVIEFEIKEDGEIIKSSMTNEKITSLIKIHKVDEKGNVLSGIEIGIFDLDGNLLGTYITDSNGEIEVELEYGSYYYQELKTDESHILNTDKVYFDVTEDGAIIETTLVNETIDVPNTSISDSKVLDIVGLLLILSGVGYIIYDKKKKK